MPISREVRLMSMPIIMTAVGCLFIRSNTIISLNERKRTAIRMVIALIVFFLGKDGKWVGAVVECLIIFDNFNIFY